MAEKSAADIMCCLVFMMWGETKCRMINVLADEYSICFLYAYKKNQILIQFVFIVLYLPLHLQASGLEPIVL